MKDKDLEKSLNDIHNTDLTFTKEDRDKVFQRIEEEHSRKRTRFFHTISHRAAPLMAMAVLLTLSVVLASSFIGGGGSQTADRSDRQAAMEENQSKSVLFLLEGEDKRTDLHLLITYNKKGTINLTSIPSDAYVPLVNTGGKTDDKDKLSHVYAYGNGAESVSASITEALDLPIDYYVAVKAEEFEAMLNAIGETPYTLEESKTLLALDGEKIVIENGATHLDGKEAVALLTDPSNDNASGWTEQNRLDLAGEVLKNMVANLSGDMANMLLGSAESNEDLEAILGELEATKLNAMETIIIQEELEPVETDNLYYLQFKEGAAKRIKKELTSFD
jgi:LCP family protein required for cell wall assembly